jgi:hypothetical protein
MPLTTGYTCPVTIRGSSDAFCLLRGWYDSINHTFCDTNSTAIDRVIAAMQLAAIY